MFVDALEYRKGKDVELRQMAKFLAEKAKQSGMDQQLGPLNPYERRIVHMAVAEVPGRHDRKRRRRVLEDGPHLATQIAGSVADAPAQRVPMFSTTDTIVAIATPPGRGGIGVVRLSGAEPQAIASRLITHRGKLEPRHATFTTVRFDEIGATSTGADRITSSSPIFPRRIPTRVKTSSS